MPRRNNRIPETEARGGDTVDWKNAKPGEALPGLPAPDYPEPDSEAPPGPPAGERPEPDRETAVPPGPELNFDFNGDAA